MRSYSSASMMKALPFPARALTPRFASTPPTIKVGSCFSAVSNQASMAVVVVLPCVPAMVMPVLPSIRLPRKSARLTTGIRAARAAHYFGIVIRDGGGTYHQVSARNVLGAVADVDGRARRLQVPCKWGFGAIRPAHRVPHFEQDASDG